MFRHRRAAGHRPAARPLALFGGVVALAAAAALTVSAHADPADPADPTPGRGPALTLDQLRRLPPVYAAIYHHPDEVNVVQRAKNRLTLACMARRHLPYHPAEPAAGAELLALAEAQVPQPFGLDTAPRKPPDPGRGPQEPDARTAAKVGHALFGDEADKITIKGRHMSIRKPAHGCVADAERTLLGDDRVAWSRARITLYEAEGAAADQLAKDPLIHDLEARWRSCMAAAGIKATSPQELRGRFGPDADLRGDNAFRADLACKHRTSYLQHAYPRLAALQHEALKADPGLLSTWYALEKREVTTARRVLAEP